MSLGEVLPGVVSLGPALLEPGLVLVLLEQVLLVQELVLVSPEEELVLEHSRICHQLALHIQIPRRISVLHQIQCMDLYQNHHNWLQEKVLVLG